MVFQHDGGLVELPVSLVQHPTASNDEGVVEFYLLVATLNCNKDRQRIGQFGQYAPESVT